MAQDVHVPSYLEAEMRRIGQMYESGPFGAPLEMTTSRAPVPRGRDRRFRFHQERPQRSARCDRSNWKSRCPGDQPQPHGKVLPNRPKLNAILRISAIPREKPLPKAENPSDSADRYPLSIDTTFWTVIDDHRGEHCRPVARRFFASPPASLFIRCNVYIPATRELIWAHIRPGSKTQERKKRAPARDELWINFPGAEEKTALYSKLVSFQGAFRGVAGLRGAREMMLTITRRDFRYMSQAINGELTLCCFSEAFRIVILATDQAKQVANLKEWIMDHFIGNGSTTKLDKKFQLDESVLPGLEDLYRIATAQRPARYWFKRSIETEPYKEVLYNFRKLVSASAHCILVEEKRTVEDRETLKRAIDEYMRLVEKYQLTRCFAWNDPSLVDEGPKRSAKNDTIMLFNSMHNEWFQMSSTEFRANQNESVFKYKYGCGQSGIIKLEDVRYYKVTRIPGYYSLTVHFTRQPFYVHFECARESIHQKLVASVLSCLGGKHCKVKVSPEVVPDKLKHLLTTVLPDAQWPVYGTTKKRSKEPETLRLVALDCKRVAVQLIDKLAIDLVVGQCGDSRTVKCNNKKDEYLALFRKYHPERNQKAGKLMPPGRLSTESAEQLQWRYGLFEAPL